MRYLKIYVMLQMMWSSALAQSVEPPPPKQGITTHASVVGALIYPGLKVGADYKVIDKEVEKSKRNGKVKVLHKNRFITAKWAQTVIQGDEMIYKYVEVIIKEDHVPSIEIYHCSY